MSIFQSIVKYFDEAAASTSLEPTTVVSKATEREPSEPSSQPQEPLTPRVRRRALSKLRESKRRMTMNSVETTTLRDFNKLQREQQFEDAPPISVPHTARDYTRTKRNDNPQEVHQRKRSLTETGRVPFQNLRKRISRMENEYTQEIAQLIARLDLQTKTHNEELEQIQQEVNKYLVELQRHHEKQVFDTKTMVKEQVTAALTAEFHSEKAKLIKEIEALRLSEIESDNKQIQELQSNIKKVKIQRRRLKKKVEELQEDLTEVKATSENLHKVIGEKQRQIDELILNNDDQSLFQLQNELEKWKLESNNELQKQLDTEKRIWEKRIKEIVTTKDLEIVSLQSNMVGDIQELTKEKNNLSCELIKLRTEVSNSSGYKMRCIELETTLSDKEESIALLQNTTDVLQQKVSNYESVISKLTKKSQLLEKRIEEVKHESEQTVHATVSDYEKRLDRLTTSYEQRIEEILQDKETEKIRIRNEITEELDKQIEAMLQTVQLEKQRTSELEKSLKESEAARRSIHNKMEDSKGKVRVYARARPLSTSELQNENKKVVSIPDDGTIKILPKNKEFTFTRVFDENSTQDDVFQHTKDLIQSALDGYNVCIFAYGQTGSGKTFTISGGEHPDTEGLVPRSIKHLYQLFTKHDKLFKYEVECYMLELYLDELHDLLAPKQKNPPQLKIKKDTVGNVVIEGITTKKASSFDSLYNIFTEGGESRHTRKTKMNEASSRSHLVFTTLITGTNLQSGEKSFGKLTFVDLAGSENRKKTQTDEMGNREALSINGSLLCLGEVICALSEKRTYIPYRNNPLTMLLSDSLGGPAKTLMFVCVSPADYNTDESVNSLMYASRVKLIQNNVSKRVDSAQVARLKKLVEKFRAVLKNSNVSVDGMEDLREIVDNMDEDSPSSSPVSSPSSSTTPTSPSARRLASLRK